MYGSHTAVCVSVVLGMISVSIRRARRGKRMMKVGSFKVIRMFDEELTVHAIRWMDR